MGWSEIFVIGVIGVLVFGPDKLPGVAKQAGQFVRTVRKMAENAKNDLGREMGTDLSGVGLRELDPRNVVRKAMFDDAPARPRTPSTPPVTPLNRPLNPGERPPFDVDAT